MLKTAHSMSAKLTLVLIRCIVSYYKSFRFVLSFSSTFWIVFEGANAAPPVHSNNNEKTTMFIARRKIIIISIQMFWNYVYRHINKIDIK